MNDPVDNSIDNFIPIKKSIMMKKRMLFLPKYPLFNIESDENSNG